MFTGIVEEMGTIRQITRGSKSSSLTISATRNGEFENRR
ncbi:hypothetical protein P7266_1351 [Lactococcus cremoris]|nr:hypothetical protein P7266_1351 [Lactococcus cremoris]